MAQRRQMPCPFPGLEKYWDKRYQYFAKWDEGIRTDREGLYSVVPEAVGRRQAELITGKTVLDGFAGIGGSAIAFARQKKLVTAIDVDRDRLYMAYSNARVYGVEALITFQQGDFFEVAEAVEADTINLDPPWGGPEYKELGKFLLSHFSPDGNELLAFSLERFSEVLLRVPTIFDMTELQRFDTPHSIYDDISEGDIISKTIIFRHPSDL